MTSNIPLETRISRAAHYAQGVMRAGLAGGLDSVKLARLCEAAVDAFCMKEFKVPMMQKRAATLGGAIAGGPVIGDPASWNPGGKPMPLVAGGGGQSGQQNSQQPQQPQPGAAQPPPAAPGPMLQNQAGVAPLPHRYNFHLDDTVHRIRRDQVAFVQKKQRESQEAQHYAGGTGLDSIAQTMDPNGQAGQSAGPVGQNKVATSGPVVKTANILTDWLARRRQAKAFNKLPSDRAEQLSDAYIHSDPVEQDLQGDFQTHLPHLTRSIGKDLRSSANRMSFVGPVSKMAKVKLKPEIQQALIDLWRTKWEECK